tara:strand:+ start:684 stop:926 length:243 start_codon:yes stop_codon:yes gene_type:complete
MIDITTVITEREKMAAAGWVLMPGGGWERRRTAAEVLKSFVSDIEGMQNVETLGDTLGEAWPNMFILANEAREVLANTEE